MRHCHGRKKYLFNIDILDQIIVYGKIHRLTCIIILRMYTRAFHVCQTLCVMYGDQDISSDCAIT